MTISLSVLVRWNFLAVVIALIGSVALPALPASAAESPIDLEAGFVDLINSEREAAGLAPLAIYPDLVVAARAQAEAVALAGELFHNPDLASVTDGWYMLGENVGYGPSLDSLHVAFMNSPAHRDNVLQPLFTHVGLGVVLEKNTIWVAEVFAEFPPEVVDQPEPVETPAPVDPPATQAVGSFGDDDGSVHEAAIEALASAGITQGCGPHVFCPDAPVTRAEMASFLTRALDLQPSGSDSFTDDQASVHQAAIEALVAAGITHGCGGGSFCPAESVSRGQMAAFLVRALELPAGTSSFVDVGDSAFAADIAALASAGITNGCDTDRYCPDAAVTRAEMASFLVRAFDL